jgi:Protein of unknown function (DUF3515).
MTTRPHRLIGAALALAVVACLTACAPTVAMTPAADANNPKCADVTVRLPDTVAGKAKRTTDAQATGAWGDPAVVLLRCGVAPIGPTTKPCIAVKSGDTTVNWVLENDPSSSVLRYITFGRTPATEVVIQHGSHGVSDADVLPALNQAIASIPQGKLKCQSLSTQ